MALRAEAGRGPIDSAPCCLRYPLPAGRCLGRVDAGRWRVLGEPWWAEDGSVISEKLRRPWKRARRRWEDRRGDREAGPDGRRTGEDGDRRWGAGEDLSTADRATQTG